MDDFRMIVDLECSCGKVSHIDTDECDKFICPKCGKVIYTKSDNEKREDGKCQDESKRI